MTFHGVLPALITPFATDGRVDFGALKALVERQIAAGVHGLVPCGTTGEAPTLGMDEHVEVIRHTVQASGSLPVLAGIGSNNTASAISTGERARDAGAEGVLATAPYYNKPTQEGLFRHFAAIAEALPEVEVCIYDVPGRTAVAVSSETIARLSAFPNITCCKDATADLAKAAETLRATPDDFSLLSGDDFTTMPFLAAGGRGCVSVVANLVPERMVAMYEAVAEGRIADAAAANQALQPLMRALFLQTNPLPVKTSLALKGLCEEVFRLPLCAMDPGPRQALVEALAADAHAAG